MMAPPYPYLSEQLALFSMKLQLVQDTNEL